MVPLMLLATVLLLFVNEKPLATTIDRDALPESIEIGGASHVSLDTEPESVFASASTTTELRTAELADARNDTDQIPVAAR